MGNERLAGDRTILGFIHVEEFQSSPHWLDVGENEEIVSLMTFSYQGWASLSLGSTEQDRPSEVAIDSSGITAYLGTDDAPERSEIFIPWSQVARLHVAYRKIPPPVAPDGSAAPDPA